MTIKLFTATGEQKGTLELPEVLFGQTINKGLIHQAIVRQQSNRRSGIAHAKNRHEVAGSTRKLYAQKHTGRARRGSIRSPLLRGGGKAFGPRKEANFVKDMPRSMRRAALAACLSYQAKNDVIMSLESYPETVKTKTFAALLGKMKLAESRRILFVLPERHHSLWLSSRNIPAVKTVIVPYLNPEDIIHSRSIVFVGDAIEKAVALFGTRQSKVKAQENAQQETEKKPVKIKKPITKKTTKKVTKKSSSSSK